MAHRSSVCTSRYSTQLIAPSRTRSPTPWDVCPRRAGLGAFRIQFSLAGYPEMESPLVHLSTGMINEQEYPVSFDNLVGGRLALHSHETKREQIDLADWHSAEPT